MSEIDLSLLRVGPEVAAWRVRLATWVESVRVQSCIVAVISLNAVILGLETDPAMMESWGFELKLADKICLVIFCIELGLKLACYRGMFWKSG